MPRNDTSDTIQEIIGKWDQRFFKRGYCLKSGGNTVFKQWVNNSWLISVPLARYQVIRATATYLACIYKLATGKLAAVSSLLQHFLGKIFTKGKEFFVGYREFFTFCWSQKKIEIIKGNFPKFRFLYQVNLSKITGFYSL